MAGGGLGSPVGIGAERLLGGVVRRRMVDAHGVVCVVRGEVQVKEICDHPALVLSHRENAYFIGEKAAGIRSLFR
jgi:hypothetical protein